MPTVRDLLAAARPRLAATPFGSPPREALLLLGRVLGLSEAQVLARDEAEVSPEDAARFAALLERRLTGEPVAYLFGEKEFWGRIFRVDDRVLIPRPETEHVVEAALAVSAGSLPESPLILDVGTGSGCLAVTLALEIPGARVVGTDLSPGALAVASGNARRLGARVGFVRTDLAAGLDLDRFHMVVSNPPYVDRSEAPDLSPEICNFEPHLALFPPGSGDSTLARLIGQARALSPHVPLILEIGRGQLPAVERHASASGLHLDRAWNDYRGVPRALLLRRNPREG